MQLKLNIVNADGGQLPAGKSLRVEIRDAAFEDAPATLLERLQTTVPEGVSSFPVELRMPSPPDGAIVWVHLDADGDGLLGPGDFITMESYPVSPRGGGEMTVRLKRIR